MTLDLRTAKPSRLQQKIIVTGVSMACHYCTDLLNLTLKIRNNENGTQTMGSVSHFVPKVRKGWLTLFNENQEMWR